MITTKDKARKIIRKSYGDDFKFQIRKNSCMIGVRPTYEVIIGIDTLAWIGLEDNRVKLGKMLPNNTIDWNANF